MAVIAEAEGVDFDVEFLKCAGDFAYFVDTYCVIDDAQGLGDGSGVMPFRLWDCQVELAETIVAERLLIILKARQMGISWLCCAYLLWVAIFCTGKLGLCYSQGQKEANEMLRRVKVLFERLPPWMLARLPGYSKRPSTTEIEWDNESRIISLPSTENAGRSRTASVVVADEFAFQAWADETYKAMKPTIDGGGKLIVLSTANGVGNLFQRLWHKATQGLNRFKAVFLSWRDRPDRDQAWYDRMIHEADDPSEVKQEYPSNPTEAFLVSGRVRFQTEWVDRQIRNVREGLADYLLPPELRNIEGLTVYVAPVVDREANRTYPSIAIGADVAEGLETGDYCDAVGARTDTLEELFNLHGRWEPDEYARLLKILSDAYGATIVVERNNHGHAVLLALANRGCERIAEGTDGRPGWHTNSSTKPTGVARVAELLRDDGMTVRTAATLDEMRNYRVLANGKTSAPNGQHDDRVMAWVALCGWMLLCGWEEPAVFGPGPFGDHRW